MKGLEQGVHGMCQGEVRRLLIPANLGKLNKEEKSGSESYINENIFLFSLW
jgi:FKBP-type peptidyl-prolyl cis-trans isomerase